MYSVSAGIRPGYVVGLNWTGNASRVVART